MEGRTPRKPSGLSFGLVEERKEKEKDGGTEGRG